MKKEDSWLQGLEKSKQLLSESEQSYSMGFNKTLLLIATGAISVSVIYITNFDGELVCKLMLIYSWMMIGVSAVLCCLEFLFVKNALRLGITYLDEAINTEDEPKNAENFHRDFKRLGENSEAAVVLGFIFLMIGLALMLLFIALNFLKI